MLTLFAALVLGCSPSSGGPSPPGSATQQPASQYAKVAAQNAGTFAPQREADVLELNVHARYPHDPTAFTQGLVWNAGRLFESTGLRGRSTLREVELETGEVLRRVENDDALFAEGLALVDDELIQLSWQEEVALRWSRDEFTPLGQFSYEGEGWGLCFDGEALVMSDGSDQLFFRDPQTFVVQRAVAVTYNGQPLPLLNELECVEGKVFANVWQTDTIVRIDPETGEVDAAIDAAGLLTEEERIQADVLNGIAYMPETGHFLITGKLWPVMYDVTFDEPCLPGIGTNDVDAGIEP